MSDIKIIVATHKPYQMPSDDIYFPVHVGAAGKDSIGFQGDDSGDNISSKNANFCELTGLYWVWKNVASEYLGLVHYRRHFAGQNNKDKWYRIADRKRIEDALRHTNIILPNKRNYYIESTYNQYAHAHHAIDLDITRMVITEIYPRYVSAFDFCMKRTDGHKFNMFIMKRKYADAYCEWLFNVLFELESRLDISSYSENDARALGFVGERLIDVWLTENDLSYCEMPVVYMEDVNWLVKGTNFLKRKFMKQNK